MISEQLLIFLVKQWNIAFTVAHISDGDIYLPDIKLTSVQ